MSKKNPNSSLKSSIENNLRRLIRSKNGEEVPYTPSIGDSELINIIKARRQGIIEASTNSYNLNRIRLNEDIGLSENADVNYNRFLSQSGWDLTKNAAINTVSEAGLGILEGAGYLADIEQWVNLARGKEEEFGNWFSDIMRKGKETIREEIAPVITDPTTDDTFRPSDGDWWAKNIPSVASALSLLIPARAGVKGLSFLGKALGGSKIISRMNSGQRLAMEGISGGFFSRYMENTMESKEVFDIIKQEAINEGKQEEEANSIAGNAASKAWYSNLSNLAFDIPQYMMVLKSFNLVKKANNITGRGIGDRIFRGLSIPVTEGIEEANQFVIARESERAGRVALGTDTSHRFLSDRLLDYIDDGELWTSFTMGALGGAVFQAAGKLMNGIEKGRQKFRQQAVNSYAEKVAANNETVFDASKDDDIIMHSLNSRERGEDAGKYMSELENIAKSDEETLVNNEIDPTQVQANLERAKTINNIVNENYDKYANNPDDTDAIVRRKVITDTKLQLARIDGQRIQNRLDKVLSKIQTDNSLDDNLTEIKRLETLAILQDNFDIKGARESRERIGTIKDLVKEVNPDITTDKQIQERIEHPDTSSLEGLTRDLLVNRDEIGFIDEELKNLDNQEYVNNLNDQKREREDKERENSLSSIVNNINESSTPQDIIQLRKQADLIDMRKEFNAALLKKVRELKNNAPKFDPDKFVESLTRRYANNDLLKEFEIRELSNKISDGAPIEDTNTLFQLYSTSEDIKKIIDNYYNIVDKIKEEIAKEEITEFSTEQENESISETYNRSQLPKAFISVGSEFEVENGRSKKDANGNLVPSRNAEFVSDHNWINRDDTLKSGSVIHYEVDFDNFSFAKDNPKQRVILMVHYIDGNTNNISQDNRKVIGVLPAYDGRRNYNSPEEKTALLNIRNEVEKFVKANPVTESGQSVGIQTLVKEKLSGVFYNTNQQHKPHEILRDGDELIFAIGKNVNGVNILEVSNHPFNNNVVRFDKENITPGAVYQILPNANGSLVPYRLYTHKLKDLPDVFELVKGNFDYLLNNIFAEDFDSVVEDINRITYIEVSREGGILKIKEGNNWVPLNNVDLQIGNKILQVDSKQLNRGNYNRQLSENRVLSTDIMPQRYVHSTSISVEPYKKKVSGIEKSVDKQEEVKQSSKSNMEDGAKSSKNTTQSPLKVDPIKGINKLGLDLGKPKTRLENTLERPYIKWNQEEEITWFKERFPNVPIEVLPDLRNIHGQGGIKAWGVFKNAIVYIHENADVGTTYHEAMHVTLNMMLNESEAASIYEEGKGRYGTEDISKIEEGLAEDYRVFEEQRTSNFPARIALFFRRLRRFFNSIFNNNNVDGIEELFYRISDNAFRGKDSVYESNSIFNSDLNFRLDNINPIEKSRRIKLINSLFLDLMDQIKEVDGHENDSDVLRSSNRLGSNLQDRILNAYSQVYSTIYQAYADLENNSDPNDVIKREKLESLLIHFVEEVKDGEITKFGDYFPLAVRDLANYGININADFNTFSQTFDTNNEENFELSEEENRLESWSINSIETNAKDTLSQEVKRKLRRLYQYEFNEETSTWEPELDDIGFPEYVDFDGVYNYIQRILADSLDSNEMVQRLEEASKYNPSLITLLDELAEDSVLMTKFFKNFSTTHANYTFISQQKKDFVNRFGELDSNNFVNIFTSNKRGVNTLIIDQWKSNLSNSNTSVLINKDSSINVENSKKLLDWLKKYASDVKKENRLSDKKIDTLFNALNRSGFNISKKAIRGQFADTSIRVKNRIVQVPAINNYIEFVSDFEKIVGTMTKGKNPFQQYTNVSQENEGQDEGEFTTLNKLARAINRVDNDLYQSSFLNVNNRTVYSYILPNFISKTVNRIKNTPILDKYLANNYYRQNIWLQELNDDSYLLDNFDYTIVDGIRLDGNSNNYTKMSSKELETVALNMYHNKDGDLAWYQVPILADSPATVFIRFKKYSKDDVLDKLYELAVQESTRIADVIDRRNRNLPEIKNYSNNTLYNFLPFLNNIEFDINNKQETVSIIRDNLDRLLTEEIESLKEIGVLGQNIDIATSSIPYDIKNISEFLDEYFYNNYLATTQITQITSGDLSFYNGIGDFQKRNSQVWKPGVMFDTSAKYGDYTVRQTYKAIYLNDQEFVSSQKKQISNVLDKSDLKGAKKKQILSLYDTINQTDGQAFITLDRWKEVLVGLGKWNAELNKAFPSIKAGRATPNQLSLIFETALKPFYFGHSFLKSGEIIPVQHKNSEFPLIPQLVQKSEDLGILLKFVEDNDIDSIQFTSAVKVGQFGAVSFEDIKSEQGDRPIVHELNNDNYILQQEVPEHYIDTENLLGSQLRKIIIGNLDEGTYSGLSKGEIVNLYQQLISQNIIDSYNSIANEFSNIENIQKLLLKEVRQRQLGEEFYEALQIKEKNGEKVFNLPLFHPIHSRRIEGLLNSVFKNNITKQKINGSSFTLLSNFGFSEELNLILNEKTGAVEGMEVMLPWWSREFFPRDENGEVDIDRIPDNILEGIGYRIPTEYFYSIRKIKVKGFTPQEAGGIVILPEETTTIAGEDFDIDKLYVVFPNFERYVEDGTTKIRKVEYGDLKSLTPEVIKGLSKDQRDNAIFDIMSSIMTHPTTAPKILEPGGFDELKNASLNYDDPITPNIATRKGQRIIFNRNMTGAGLVGIFANYNSNHNILQFGDAKLNEQVKIGKKSYSDLTRLKNDDGEYISKVLASFLAASVDNAKDPVADSLNINSYTAPMLGLLVRLGIPLQRVLGIINQPIIKHVTSRHFNESINNTKTLEVLKDLRDASLKKVDVSDTGFLGEDYFPDDNTLLLYATDSNNQTKGYYVAQALIADLWLHNYGKADRLNKVMQSMRGDTLGATKSLAANSLYLDSIRESKLQADIDNIKEYFEEDVYPIMKNFIEYGIEKPQEILKDLIPTSNIMYSNIRRTISENKGFGLSEREINDINNQYLQYYTTGFDFFNTGETRDNIIKQTPNKLSEYKNVNSNPLTNRLSVVTEDTGNRYIEFYNIGSLTNAEKESITSAWRFMLEFGTKEENQLAKDLVNYVIFTEGFEISPNSFGRFIPVSYLSQIRNSEDITLSDYFYKLVEESKAKTDDSNFVQQFLRNNYHKGFVRNINFRLVSGVKRDSKTKRLVSFVMRETEPDNLPDLYKLETGAITDLYRFVGLNNTGNPVYHITTKLGKQNRVREYDRNNNTLGTIFNENKIPRFSEDNYLDIDRNMYQLDTNVIDIENIYNLRNTDGSRKRFVNWNLAYNLVRRVNKQLYGTPYKATLTKIQGEKGDTRIYNAVKIHPRNQLPDSNEISTPIEELDRRMFEYMSQFGVTVKLHDRIKASETQSALGTADIYKRIINIVRDRRDTTLPHEVGHFVYNMMQQDSDIQRVNNLINKTQIYQDIKRRYKDIYSTEEDFKEEAVATLIGQQIVNKYLERSEPKTLASRLILLVDRLLKKVRNIFSGKNIEKDIDSIVANTIGDVAEGILDNTLNLDTSNLDNVKKKVSPQLIDRQQEILENAIDVINKKINIYRARDAKDFTKRERQLLKSLRKELSDENFKLGLVKFTNAVSKDLERISSRYDKLLNDRENISNKEAASVLRRIKDYTGSYLGPLKEAAIELSKEDSARNRIIVREIDSLVGEIERLENNYLETSKDVIVSVLKEFAADRGQGNEVNIKEALTILEKDIVFTRRWLDSLAESRDDILKLTDKMVKEYKQYARLESITINKDLIAAKKKLERQGIPSASFVYERDYDGNLSGNLISKYNIVEWEKAKENFFEDLNKKFGIKVRGDKPPTGTRERIEWNRQVAKWFSENTQPNPDKADLIERRREEFIKRFGEERGQIRFEEWYTENTGIDYQGEEYYKRDLSIPSEKYLNSVYDNLSPEELEFLNLIWSIKTRMDEKIPEKNKKKYLAPQIRKDIVERWKDKGAKGVAREFGEQFVRVEDDIEFGLTDENGNPVNFLPVYFTTKLNNVNDLSLDIVSTMSSYAYMALDFDNMNKIVDTLELTRDVLAERQVMTGKFDPVSLFKKQKPITVDGVQSNAFQRYEQYLDMVVYGRRKKDEGSILGIDKAKAIDAFGTYVSVSSLALNLFAGIANPLLGNALTRQEAIAKEYFDNSNLLQADKIYLSELPNTMANIGQRETTSKLDLWIEKMDTLQDYNQRIREIDAERKTLFTQSFKLSSLFFINKAGEHQIQSRTSLALADSIQLKGADGKVYNLWDAYEVKGNRLELSQRYTIIPDGKTFKEEDSGKEFTDKELIRFINKQNFINKRLQGIYNDIDKSAIQQRALGRIAIMYRKFIKPGWNRRFENLTFNEEGEVWTEGYYNTTSKFVRQLYKDIKSKQVDLKGSWNDLTDMQRANIIRANIEVGYMIAVSVLATILTNLSDDDEDNWALNMTAYQANRLYTELAFYVNPNEAFRILKSPAAAVNQLQKIVNFIDFTNWADEIERGRYKGMYKGQKELLELIPIAPTVKKIFTPEEQLQFFTK